ncbi:MAG: hypothetical protein ACI8Y8_004186, partial [Planctomycetota bacterium]
LGGYEGTPLARPALRRMTVVWSLLAPLLVLGLAIAGASKMTLPGARQLLLLFFAYFLVTALVVSMSRFRMPLIPFCIVLAAGALDRRALNRPLSVALGLCLLFGLWWIDLPLVAALVGQAWGGAS